MEFEQFLADWDEKAEVSNASIALFDNELAKGLSENQKQAFVRCFYHLRGHFHDFLWYLGNTAETAEDKKVIVANIMEEFGGGRLSHEMLYFRFAKEFGVDIEREEVVQEKTNLEFARHFNKGHIEWLVEHRWEQRVAMFAAYERLDNIDYSTLMEFAQNIGTSGEGLEFFRVHTKVQHFEAAYQRMGLQEMWKSDSSSVVDAFEFIREHQGEMWRSLSDYVLAQR